MKKKFYSLTRILAQNADYNIIFGERSNGKTYAALCYGIEQFLKTGKQMAYIRRWREDLRGKRAESLFAGHIQNGFIEKQSKGQYDSVFYYAGKWFLSKYDSKTKKHSPCNVPFCFGFALSETEHEKSTSYPNVTTIVFDEFLTRRYYLPDEFMLFMNSLSTIIRDRNDVKVFMLGNTVNKYCPYFSEMGLRNVQVQKQGTIDIYEFGNGGAVVAVEYCAPSGGESGKASNKYFCFDNENLQMITSGKWELAVYPHLPCKYAPKDVLAVFFIIFGDAILQGNVIQTETDSFIFIHAKTTPIKDDGLRLVYSLMADGKPNHRRALLSTATPYESAITRYFAMDKVFYQSNEIGEVVRNYIKVSAQKNILA